MNEKKTFLTNTREIFDPRSLERNICFDTGTPPLMRFLPFFGTQKNCAKGKLRYRTIFVLKWENGTDYDRISHISNKIRNCDFRAVFTLTCDKANNICYT